MSTIEQWSITNTTNATVASDITAFFDMRHLTSTIDKHIYCCTTPPKCTDILLEGQQQGDHKHGLMGMYELVEGKEVNGRGVWQMAGGKELFMYYSSSQWWIVNNREWMEAGEADGWMCVASTALTPDQVTKTWKVADIVAKAWVDVPKVRARMCSVEEKRAAAERLEQERQQAMERLEQTRTVEISDFTASKPSTKKETAATRQVRDISMLDCI
jgi:hypothetical protein